MNYDYKKMILEIKQKCLSKGGVVKYFRENAKIIGCSYQALGNWGKKHNPSLVKIDSLCKHFGLNINDFKQDN